MLEVCVLGVGMTRFGKFLDRSLKELGQEALELALKDAGIDREQLEIAFVGNSMAGIITGQESVRGQVILHACGMGDIPVVNVENACATGSTAFAMAHLAVASGKYEVALVLGVEKLFHRERERSFRALASAMDIDTLPADAGTGGKGSVFVGRYARLALAHMAQYGTRKEHFAQVAVKNAYNGSLNPYAQYQRPTTLEAVLTAPVVEEPLTRLMCSPISDGAAAAILCNAAQARRHTTTPIWVRASVLRTCMGCPEPMPGIIERTARQAYEEAGLGPADLQVVEIHDATEVGELIAYEELGLCPRGEGKRLVEEGTTSLRGALPVNTSGGLLSRGHPVGATGVAQIVEIVWQLRQQAGKRQVNGAKVGMAQSGGGYVGGEAAAEVVSILSV